MAKKPSPLAAYTAPDKAPADEHEAEVLGLTVRYVVEEDEDYEGRVQAIASVSAVKCGAVWLWAHDSLTSDLIEQIDDELQRQMAADAEDDFDIPEAA